MHQLPVRRVPRPDPIGRPRDFRPKRFLRQVRVRRVQEARERVPRRPAGNVLDACMSLYVIYFYFQLTSSFFLEAGNKYRDALQVVNPLSFFIFPTYFCSFPIAQLTCTVPQAKRE
jgi:hypothetical protein